MDDNNRDYHCMRGPLPGIAVGSAESRGPPPYGIDSSAAHGHGLGNDSGTRFYL